MQQGLLISVFGILGVLSRWGLDLALKPFLPYPTLIINVLGSFLAGIVFHYIQQNTQPQLMSAILIGGLGGFTTFSAFAVQSLQQLQAGEVLTFLAYGLTSWLGSVLGAWGGFALMRAFIS